MVRELRSYQSNAIDEIAAKYGAGKRRIVFQAATGSGKTVTFSGLTKRFIENTGKKALISVHRFELLSQARKTLYDWYGIVAEPITAGTKYRNPNADVYVTMVQTAINRIKRNPRWFGDIGMLIIDEAHLKNHDSLISSFENVLTVGFTATPISASKKHPMNETYEDIVSAIGIPELIKAGALCPNKTYHIKGGVNRAGLKIRNGEFDAKEMFHEFSKGKHVENCLKGYEEYAKGKKTLIFNCSVEHSEIVNKLFVDHGYPSKHLDGATSQAERTAILEWFAETPGAILHNVGVLTAGFDEPSVECIIMNRITKSLPLWLQCTGRGARTYPGKEFFTIIDMGGNALEHGDWSSPRDWKDIFMNPDTPKGEGDGVAPVKLCPECDVIIPAQARVCFNCGHEFPVTDDFQENEDEVEFELLSASIDLKSINKINHQAGRNPYSTLHQIKGILIAQIKDQITEMNDKCAYELLNVFQEKVKQWCADEHKNYDEWHKQTTSEWFFAELKNQFQYERPILKLEL